MEELDFLDDATNVKKNKEAREEKGLPTKKEKTTKARTKKTKVSQTLRLEEWVRVEVAKLEKQKKWSYSQVIEELLIKCFEKGVKI